MGSGMMAELRLCIAAAYDNNDDEEMIG